MKKLLLLTLVLASCVIFKVYAEDAKAVTPQAGDAQLVQVNNKICPVSHEEVGQNGMAPHKVTYKGKVYNLCCSMCEKDFNKDPEKYSKIMDEEVAAEQADSAKKM